jgi:hypothetical protein
MESAMTYNNLKEAAEDMLWRAFPMEEDLPREEIIRRTADDLVDYVHEYLGGYDCGSGKWYGEPYQHQIAPEAFRFIRRLVASAMLAQFEHDHKWFGEAAREQAA